MPSPLDSIAGRIGKAFAGIFRDALLVRTVSAPNPDEPWEPGLTATTTYPCRGLVENYSDFALANSLIDAQDRKVLILAASLAIVPTDGDSVAIAGVTWRVIHVRTDPARAVWELQARA